MKNYLKNLSEKNCDKRLRRLYRKRERISKIYSKRLKKGKDILIYEEKYSEVVNTIDMILRKKEIL